MIAPMTSVTCSLPDEERHTGPFGDSNRATMGIALKDLSFSYGTTVIFQSLSVATSARLLVLRGPSGCGKTTFLKLSAGILQPKSGSVSPQRENPVYISQEDALFPWLTGWQNIKNVAGVSEDAIEASPLYSRIKGFLQKRAFQLSFGQRRLIEIARALLVVPDLLCLDEPFNFVDPASRALVQELLVEPPLHLKNVTMLISSHYESDFAVPGIATMSFDGSIPVTKLSLSVKT